MDKSPNHLPIIIVLVLAFGAGAWFISYRQSNTYKYRNCVEERERVFREHGKDALYLQLENANKVDTSFEACQKLYPTDK